MIEDTIARLVEKQALSRTEAAQVMRALMEGNTTPAQTAGLLVALRMKGETVEEITGFAETMRAFATRVPTSRRPLVDTCGTGGDRSGSFNISTTAAFVAAGAGVAVAKHGNRSASSQCGSADVLEALGVNIEASPETVGRCIDKIGIGFLFARTLHGAMSHVGGPRRELRLRTVFNVLGPLTNPAGACGQVVGVFDAGLIETLCQVLMNLGGRHALVVAGADGLDEMSLSGPTQVAEGLGGDVRLYTIEAESLGLGSAPREALRGGGPEENAALLKAVLEGEKGPHRDVALLNAAAGIRAGCEGMDWREGLETARRSIDSGAALAKLDELVKASHDS